MKLVIRRYLPADQNRLIEILKFSTPEFFHPREKADFVQYLSKYLEDYFVIESDAVVVGCGGINYLPLYGEARISWDIVHPEFRSKGIGSTLLKHRLNEIKGGKIPVSKVVVRSSQKAFHFYQKFGFTLVHSQKDYWAPGFDLFELEMAI
ncbi:MAG: GNAT family N-acetyltransferase [Flavobacteriales bacterium]|nr:GNAT family N-acetyltransferase [Flavobacteriales bacterium]